jgi:hypothetical protein
MAKQERPWTVTPHGPIEQLDDNLWVVAGQVPRNPAMNRRMAIARLSDGRLVFYNAIPLEEPAMQQLASLGKPSLLILPSHFHMMDGHAFQQRLGLEVYAPLESPQVATRVKVAGALDAFPRDAAVRFETVAGSRYGEPIMIVESGDAKRTSLVFCDAFMNNPAHGGSFFLRLTGFMGGPKVAPIFRLFLLRDRRALREQLERLAALPALARLVPSHGAVVAEDAAGVLARVAATL